MAGPAILSAAQLLMLDHTFPRNEVSAMDFVHDQKGGKLRILTVMNNYSRYARRVLRPAYRGSDLVEMLERNCGHSG